MLKKKKALVVKDPNCLNCGYPFTRDEKFCPECGQDNKGSKITFINFTAEMFRGFFSWDAKFWRTLIPLLIRPGQVSANYISGKRNRYSNPFRFYLSVSILFFLLVSLNETYKKIDKLQGYVQEDEEQVNLLELDFETPQKNQNKDSITQQIIHRIKVQKGLVKDSLTTRQNTDTLGLISNRIRTKNAESSFSNEYVQYFLQYNKLYPEHNTSKALSILGVEKNFSNNFWYSRAVVINKIAKSKEERDKFIQQMVSLGSIALFILLPLFTLSLKIIYIRRAFTYIEHLIFVFHIQTVFFLLLSLFFLIDIFSSTDIADTAIVFVGLFGIYLFLAMKKFYNQSFFRTLVKYCMANTFFLILTSIGVAILSTIVFALF